MAGRRVTSVIAMVGSHRVSSRPTRRIVRTAGSFLIGVAVLATAIAAVPAVGRADTSPMCGTEPWDGASAAGPDLAYRIDAAPIEGEYECYIAQQMVNAENTRPIRMTAGYRLDDGDGDSGFKSLVYVQIQCFDDEDTVVFKQSTASNIFEGAGETGWYPRALFYPSEAGSYDCGVRVVNAFMGQDPLPVYAVSGYLNAEKTAGPHGQDGSVDPATDPPDFPDGTSDFLHMDRGTKTAPRRLEPTVPEGVSTLYASSNVNYTNCSRGRYDEGKCPAGSFGNRKSRHKQRIVAWQTRPGTDEVCRYLAEPDAPANWKVVYGARHHKGLMIEADLTMTDDTSCSRHIVVKTVIEMGSSQDYDSGFAASRSTVLSVSA